MLRINAAEKRLAEDLDEGQMVGIEGVPLIIFAGRYSVAGAYPADVLVNAIDACMRLHQTVKSLANAPLRF